MNDHRHNQHSQDFAELFVVVTSIGLHANKILRMLILLLVDYSPYTKISPGWHSR